MSSTRGWSWGLAVAAIFFATPLAAQQRQGDAVTFTKDVAPILQRSCVT